MIKQFLFLLLPLSFISLLSSGQEKSFLASKAHMINTIDSILNSQVADGLIPGAVIEIKRDDRVLYKNAYGCSQKYDFHHQLLHPAPKMNTPVSYTHLTLPTI